MVMDEIPDSKIVREKARKDATKDIAAEIPFGGRRGVNAVVLKKSLENVEKKTEAASEQTLIQIQKEGKVGGSKVS